MQTELSLNNVPELSVSELAFSIKRTLEDTYGRVRLRGELGRLTFHSSGHLYGNIKDDKATIDIVCWRGNLSKLSIRPEEGLEVICTGKMSSYPARSNYQFQIESMELAGEGALLKMLEQRKKKLAAEGLFDPTQKKPIPFLPKKIGVITSPTGAVIKDILHRIRDRFPAHVQLYPVRVQGETAANEVVSALEAFERMSDKPDTLILARGGGSLEDLMPFNEEDVVRAVANCTIPTITAIGHETDTTLVDHASDLRAPTPTGAAEMAVPVRANLMAQVLEDEQRLVSSMQRSFDLFRQKLQSARLQEPKSILEIKIQGLDHVVLKLQGSFEKYISGKKEKMVGLGSSLRHPRQILEEKSRILTLYKDQLERVQPRLLTERKQGLESLGRMLESLSFKSVLARGYVVVKDIETNKPVSDSTQTAHGQKLMLQFRDEKDIKVTVE